MEIAAGTVIDDRYEVLGPIGTGAVAEVYLARHLQLGSLVAVKVLLLPTAAVQSRLMQEGRLQGALRDRHVVSVTDMVEIDGCPGLVMEYVRGPSLQRLLQHLQFDLTQATALGTGILLGVRAAHQIGLVHRDLKPANVLIDVTDTALVPKIADFGLAKLLQPDAEGGGTATRTGSTLGTPAYMAPEQIRDARQVDERADVFSLGAVLYELLTGRRAFPGDDLLDLYDHIRDGRYVPVRTLAPEVPPELERVIDQALAVDRDQRIGSVQELLDRFTGGKGDAAAEIEWSGSVLSLAAGLAPDQGRETSSHGTSGATFDLDAPGPRPDAPSVERARTPTPARPRSRAGPATLIALAALGIGGAALGCAGGTALIGIGLASDFIEWGPRMTPERQRVAYTATEIPRVSAVAAVEREIELAWGDLRQASSTSATTHLATAATLGEVTADPGPHLLLATALLWDGDPGAYEQIEQAAVLAEKRKGPVADLARLADAATRGSLDVQRVDAHLAAWPDDLLAPLLLASLDGWDLERRITLLRGAAALDPDGAAAPVLLAELLLERGRDAEAAELLDGSAPFADHPRMVASRGAWLLRGGDPGGARALVERALARGDDAPLLTEVFAGALRVQGDLEQLAAIETRLAADGDVRRRVAHARGAADAAFGLGRVEEAAEWLDRAFTEAIAHRRLDDAVALFRQRQLMALLGGHRDDIERAWQRGRDVAALGGMPSGLHDRLAPRLVLLEGIVAAHDGDFERAQAKLTELRGIEGRERLANLLALAAAGLHQLPLPDVPLEGCTQQALRADWLDASGTDPAAAEAAWAALVAEDSTCLRHGPERFVRARAEAALARAAAARQDVAAAEFHLAEVDRWAPDPDLASAVFDDAAIAQEGLAWLRQR